MFILEIIRNEVEYIQMESILFDVQPHMEIIKQKESYESIEGC